MGRKATKITTDELREKVFAFMKKNPNYAKEFENGKTPKGYKVASFFGYAHEKVKEDISKIFFDFENSESDDEYKGDKKDPESFMGLHTLDNGFTFWGMWAGGDWEYPVFFIVYWDGKGLRGYIPEDGNAFNKVFRTAYGSEGEKDVEIKASHRKKFIEMFPDHADKINEIFNEEDYDVLPEYTRDWAEEDGIDFEWDKIEADIKGRIQVV